MEFVNQQGLAVHVKCKHPLNRNETVSVRDNALLKKVDKPMTEVANLQASPDEGTNANESNHTRISCFFHFLCLRNFSLAMFLKCFLFFGQFSASCFL